MKKTALGFVFALVILATASFAIAADSAEQPASAQYQFVIGGQASVLTTGAGDSKLDVLGVRASIHILNAAGNTDSIYFTYAGLTSAPTNWLWLSGQGGFVGNYDPSGYDAPLASLWVNVTPFAKGNHSLGIFAEEDAYFLRNGSVDYYSFGSLDYTYKMIRIGGQVEEINKIDLATYGPHLGFFKGPFEFQAQYYGSAKAELKNMHIVRLNFTTMF